MPKNKNKKNSALFDSSKIQSRLNMFVDHQKTSISAMLVHDSIDYIVFEIYQHQGFKNKATIFEGQKYSFIFEDSTRYDFKIEKLFGNGYSSPGGLVTNSVNSTMFIMPLTDSLKTILSNRRIKSVLMNNQGAYPIVQDREFKTLVLSDIYFSRIFCCFEAFKNTRGIK